MPRDYGVYLEDIVQAVERIEKYTDGYKYDDLVDDNRTFDAVVRNLEVIGEAAKSIPDTIREKAPEIEWKKIAGMRDIMVHEYFGIDAEIVWDVVQSNLPDLKAASKRLLATL